MMFFHAAIGYRWKSSNQRERARGCGFWRQSFLFFESCNECKGVSALHIPMQLYIYLYEYFHRQFAFALKPLLMCVFSMRTQADVCSSLFITCFFNLVYHFCPSVRFFSRVRNVHASAGDQYRSIFFLDQYFFEYFSTHTTRHSYQLIGWFESGNRLKVFLERSLAGRSSFKISAGPTILGHGISAIPPRWNALLDWERMDSESRWKLHSGISEFHPFIFRTLVCILVSTCILVSCVINWNNR